MVRIEKLKIEKDQFYVNGIPVDADYITYGFYLFDTLLFTFKRLKTR